MKDMAIRFLTALWVLCGALAASSALAQGRDDYGEISQTVARVSYISGTVSFSRGDDPDNWQPADRNVPMTLGDRVYTGSRSRLELQVHGGDVIRLGSRSDLGALNLTDDSKQFSVKIGIASFQIRNLSDYETFEVDTPNSAVSFEADGTYRVDVDPNGDTRVWVRRGRAIVAAGGGQVRVESGEGIEVYGLDRPQYDYLRVSGRDGWDLWVEQRETRFARARSYQYCSADIVGVDDLDEYGRWERVPEYGWAWSPLSVEVGWAPYRVGHWVWQDPWGWSWVSAEPWGWAPYHYGRWVTVGARWYWIPVAPSVRYVRYSPALVAFVGGGPGWSLSISAGGGGGGFIGWFPLGPRDPFVPWWGGGVRTTTVTNVTYVNRTYVTVINRNTFVSGGVVSNAFVRDQAVISQVASAPVLRGPLPAVPTAGALRVAATTEARSAPRPPAQVIERAVVVRAAPPPAPPTFQSKLQAITQNQGAPVAPAEAARMSVQTRGRPQAVTEVKPVVAEPGQITLQPRSTEAREQKRPEPVTVMRGRPMATTQQPVSASPVTGGTPPSGQPSREIVPRQIAPPAEVQTPAERRGRERGPVVVPTPQPQPEEFRQRIQPTQPPTPEIERRRIERGPAPVATPEEGAPPPGLERRRREFPTPSPPAENIERRRIERPTPVPEPQHETGQDRRREGRPQGQPQVQPTQPPPQGEGRPQIEGGRPAPAATPQPEEGKGKGRGRGREPEKTPTPKS